MDYLIKKTIWNKTGMVLLASSKFRNKGYENESHCVEYKSEKSVEYRKIIKVSSRRREKYWRGG